MILTEKIDRKRQAKQEKIAAENTLNKRAAGWSSLQETRREQAEQKRRGQNAEQGEQNQLGTKICAEVSVINISEQLERKRNLKTHFIRLVDKCVIHHPQLLQQESDRYDQN